MVPPEVAPGTVERPGPITSAERSLAPDLARGSVLLFIALANVVSYLYGSSSGPGYRPVGGSIVDRTTDLLVSLFVDARSYPMFAMLFGYGMMQMVRRSERRGATWPQARRLLLRRNLWLIVFGLLHATLLFEGDILGPYGATGILVLLFFHRSSRVLAVWASISIALLGAFFGGFGAAAVGTFLFSPPSYTSGVVERLINWSITTVAIFVLMGLLGPMLIGVLVGRSEMLDRPWDSRDRLRRLAVFGVATSVVGGLPFALIVAGIWQVDSTLTIAVVQGLHAVVGIAGGLGYLCIFGLIAARRPARTGPVNAVAAAGERSLTCYLLQSVVLAPVFSAWGLGLGGRVGTAAAYLVAACTWLLTVGVAVLLARSGRRGPAEVVLRRLTYGPPAGDRRTGGVRPDTGAGAARP